MIRALNGVLAHTLDESTRILWVGGVGYEVHALGPMEAGVVWVSHVVREDSARLFGSNDIAHVHAFEQLLRVRQVGPGTAQKIVRHLGAFFTDATPFESVKGVGPKLAAALRKHFA